MRLFSSFNYLRFIILLGIDGGRDIDPQFLSDIYERVRETEFKPGSDHVTQVIKVDRTIVGKKPVSPLGP